MNLSEVIKTRRRTLGISQIDLSEMSGVALATIKDTYAHTVVALITDNRYVSSCLRIGRILLLSYVYFLRITYQFTRVT